MTIKQQDNVVTFEFAQKLNPAGLKRLREFARYLELGSGMKKVKQSEIDKLAREITKSAWMKSKKRLLKP
jgi:hypothetical protein